MSRLHTHTNSLQPNFEWGIYSIQILRNAKGKGLEVIIKKVRGHIPAGGGPKVTFSQISEGAPKISYVHTTRSYTQPGDYYFPWSDLLIGISFGSSWYGYKE